ncbi:hypothetical protein ACFO5Q_03910 [Kordiimonas lipolytica]|uniref:Uncharacterized protein n=1 Tax=Kordiimonas lipolytica TaxID=1662421 RepID=A0ABV8U714_9PROT|nr:hypothetical protein [Kordiimonas lipolytica]
MQPETDIAKNSYNGALDAETERRISRKAFFLGAAGSLLAVLAVFTLIAIFFDVGFLPEVLCDKKYPGRVCFYDDAWDSETYLSVITGFYGTIITILVGLLGVVAAFAFFVIRGDAIRQSEEAIEDEIKRYFSTVAAEKMVSTSLTKVAESRRTEIEKQMREIHTEIDDLKLALVEAEVLIDGQLEIEDEEAAPETN